VRHLRCRREEWSSLHGFTLAPLGHHPRLRMVCPHRGQWVRAERFLSLFTSPRVHPRSARASPAVTYSVPPPGTVGELMRSSLYISSHGMENLYTICGHTPSMSPFQRRSRTRQLIASGGGAPCLTEGDTRAKARGNPWRNTGTKLRRRKRRTESVKGVSSALSEVAIVRHRWCQRIERSLHSRVRPSGIIRG